MPSSVAVSCNFATDKSLPRRRIGSISPAIADCTFVAASSIFRLYSDEKSYVSCVSAFDIVYAVSEVTPNDFDISIMTA